MILRLIVLVSVLVLELMSERELKAEVPAQACKSTVTGTLEMVPFESKVYGDKRLMRVWLPTGYSSYKASAKRYPVLYLFDAQDLFDRCTARPGQDEWHVDETLRDLIARKAVQPLIVVGIDNSGPGHRERMNTPGIAPWRTHRKSSPPL
jgi:enterochelin esterase-like enzyme